nr:hypothetical protein MarFTME_168 [Marseillevirus futianmevirus]
MSHPSDRDNRELSFQIFSTTEKGLSTARCVRYLLSKQRLGLPPWMRKKLCLLFVRGRQNLLLWISQRLRTLKILQ